MKSQAKNDKIQIASLQIIFYKSIMTININNLSMTFSKKDTTIDVLKGVNLQVKKGEVFALMGSNGAGKTTLLKILSTLIYPSSGSATICNFDLKTQPEMVRNSIGFVFDSDRTFYQVLSVEENLKFYGRAFGLSEHKLNEKMLKLLDEFNLLEYRNTKINHCSSGVKQKIAFLRAFILNPQVIFIDEPSRSLDDDSKTQMFSYLKNEVKKHEKTCIFVSHSENEVKEWSDRYGYLKDGKIEIQ